MAPRIWHRSVDGALMRTDELIEWVSGCMSAVGPNSVARAAAQQPAIQSGNHDDSDESHDQPTRTAKERLGVKASDEQRVDNCKVHSTGAVPDRGRTNARTV
jgi:hypothetical protein